MSESKSESGESRPTTPSAEGAPPAAHGHGHAHGHASADSIVASLTPEHGWHFLHMYYQVDRAALERLTKEERRKAKRRFLHALDRGRESAPEQLHAFAVIGHKADFGFMAAGADLHRVHGVQLELQRSRLGEIFKPTYSFYSITEISEYVPDTEAYGELLKREGADPNSDMYKAKVANYAKRLGPMNQQRLYPDFPDWPCMCFYPMSKMRSFDQNWYLLPFEKRAELMAQHGKSGMKFAGKISQVITASTGLDDWEWGVTLWAKNPAYLKDIVYTMRFDESSARYAIFGDFYFGYIQDPKDLAQTLGI